MEASEAASVVQYEMWWKGVQWSEVEYRIDGKERKNECWRSRRLRHYY